MSHFSFLLNFVFIFIIFKKIILINSTKNEKKYFRTINNNKTRQLENIKMLNNLISIESIDDKVSYISSTTDENGNIYLLISSENTTCTNRLVYIIKSDFSEEHKILMVTSSITYTYIYPIITTIKILNKTYIGSISQKAQQFEIINYNKSKIYSCPFDNVINSNALILKNTFTSIKYYENKEYILNAFIEKKNSNLLIQKLYIRIPDISVAGIKSTETSLSDARLNSTVSCFEMGNYIECLYANSDLFYTISIFNISSLKNIYNSIIETNPITIDKELFSKCIHIKNNIGMFMYFLDESQFPKLQFKNLEINNNIYILNDYIDNINIITVNSNGIFSLNYNYIYNDIVKSNENTIFYINSRHTNILIYVIIIRLLNNDRNIVLNYYEIKINEYYNIAVYKDITAFSLNGLLGIGMTHYNYNLDIYKTYSSFCIFGNITINDDISINIPNNTNIFKGSNNYEIKISEIIEKIKISNNAFGYIFAGIKIPLLDEDNFGFYIYSNSNDKKIKQNEIILINDTIIFKMNSTLGVKLGQYSIEYQIIIKEPEFEDFISYPNLIEYYPKNDSINNETLYKTFFQPDTFSGRVSYINFMVDECYISCQNCTYYGDALNHHCDDCSSNYPFSYNIINGHNCVGNCPANYIIQEYKCIKEEEKNEDITEENFEEENNEDNVEEEKDENNEEESNKENVEEEKKENNEEKDRNIIEEEKEKDKVINIENNCKKYFYIDENLKINCIDGDICIDDYPHIDRNINNMCTNCIVKYNNKCYIDCPINTCIKQDLNLDTCIDIDNNTKVINQICFENFDNLTHNLKEMSDNNIIIQNIPNLTVYVYNIKKDTILLFFFRTYFPH